MSSWLPERNVGPEPPRYAAEEDVAPYGKIALVGLGVAIVFALSVFLMWRIEKAAYRPNVAPVPQTVGHAEINGVKQAMFDLEDGAKRARHDDEQWLNGYGWIDEDAGIAHIPVDEAMKLALQPGGALTPSLSRGEREFDGGTQ